MSLLTEQRAAAAAEKPVIEQASKDEFRNELIYSVGEFTDAEFDAIWRVALFLKPELLQVGPEQRLLDKLLA